jgi:anti-sigma regulatory factor (Ser/Thr protein kinase)
VSNAPSRPRGRTKPTLLVSLPSETAYLGLVREMTKRMAELAGFSEPVAEKLALAVDEAATNVIEHAYKGAADREVDMRFEDRGPDFRVELVDTGQMVDPRAVPHVDIDKFVTERRTGGLGMHLMEKIMDSVTFRRSARRNVCALVKHKEGEGTSRG